MIAQGGDPEAMSVTQYLDYAYSALVDDRVRRGANLFDALDDTRSFAARTGSATIEPTPAGGNTYQPAEPPPAVVEAQNDKALQDFMNFMGGLGGSVR